MLWTYPGSDFSQERQTELKKEKIMLVGQHVDRSNYTPDDIVVVLWFVLNSSLPE